MSSQRNTGPRHVNEILPAVLKQIMEAGSDSREEPRMTITDRIRATKLYESEGYFSPVEIAVVLGQTPEVIRPLLVNMEAKGELERKDYKYRKSQSHPAKAIFDKRVRKRTLPIPKLFGERNWVAV
jgi:hypothetical protein